MERLCSGQFVSCYLQKRLVFSSSFKKDIFIIKGIIRSNVQKAVGIWYSTTVSCPYIKVDYLFPKLLIICLRSSPSLPKVKTHFYCRLKDRGGKLIIDNTAKCQTNLIKDFKTWQWMNTHHNPDMKLPHSEASQWQIGLAMIWVVLVNKARKKSRLSGNPVLLPTKVDQIHLRGLSRR